MLSLSGIIQRGCGSNRTKGLTVQNGPKLDFFTQSRFLDPNNKSQRWTQKFPDYQAQGLNVVDFPPHKWNINDHLLRKYIYTLDK